VTGKPEWGSGPWDEEPDELLWWDERTGLPCLVLRHPEFGGLCGYVGVHQGHPWFEDGEVEADVHGGLTFSNRMTVKHEPGVPDGFWWLGFDCSHSGDLAPGLAAGVRKSGGQIGLRPPSDVYRTFDFVKNEVTELAKQAGEAGGVTMLLLAFHNNDRR
jgi:hypothetical protein